MIKQEKGISLVSLVIVVALMTIIASTVVQISLNRFKINELKKMYNDLELLQDKVSNYYLRYNVLPILRDNTNDAIKYTYTTLDFTQNNENDANYYILDLQAMEGIALNYGEFGFKNPNLSTDVYIINEDTHIVYYVEGKEVDGVTYHTIVNDSINNIVPPSSPQINVISGNVTTDDEGKQYYTTNVEIEILPGNGGNNGVGGTEYSLNGGTTWQELGTSRQVISLTKNGEYIIKARTYDNSNNKNYSAEAQLMIKVSKVAVGLYVKYEVSYTDMYQGIKYTSTTGWRYLGTDDDGNELLVSTAIPIILYYSSTTDGENSKWWDTNTELNANLRTVNGMLNNFEKIPYTMMASGINASTANTAIGRFDGSTEETAYTAIGKYFRATGESYSNNIKNVRALTLADLNNATNAASGATRSETETSAGFKDLGGEASGLFNMQELENYAENYNYWLATASSENSNGMAFSRYNGDTIAYGSNYRFGARVVVVLSSKVQLKDLDNDGILEIR